MNINRYALFIWTYNKNTLKILSSARSRSRSKSAERKGAGAAKPAPKPVAKKAPVPWRTAGGRKKKDDQEVVDGVVDSTELDLQERFAASPDVIRAPLCLHMNDILGIPMDAIVTVLEFAVMLRVGYLPIQCILRKSQKPHVLPLTNVVFDCTGTRLATGSYDRTAKVWDLTTGAELLSLEGHRNVVYSIIITASFVITGSFDKTVKVWDLSTGECLRTFKGHTKEVVCVSIHPTTDMIVSGGMDNLAILWNPRKTDLAVHTLKGHTAEVVTLQFIPGANKVITGSFDKTGRIWNTKTGACLHILAIHKGEISHISGVCVLGDFCVLGSTDHTASIWRVSDGTQVHGLLRGHTDEILDVKINPLGTIVACASADRKVTLHNIATGRLIHTLTGHEGEISMVCFHPRGRYLASASADKTCKIWDVTTGECIETLEGSFDEVFTVEFDASGKSLVTASKDNLFRYYEVSPKGGMQ